MPNDDCKKCHGSGTVIITTTHDREKEGEILPGSRQPRYYRSTSEIPCRDCPKKPKASVAVMEFIERLKEFPTKDGILTMEQLDGIIKSVAIIKEVQETPNS